MFRKILYGYLLPIALTVCIIPQVFAASPFEKALALVDQGNYTQAARSLEDLLKKEPTHSEKQAIHHVLGYCYEKGKKWAKGIEHYTLALSATYPLADYVIYHIAESYGQMKDNPNAIVWYQRLIDEHPQSVHFASAKYELGKVQYHAGNHAKALKNFLALIADSKNSYVRKATYEAAKTYARLGDRKKAQDTYQQLINANNADMIAQSSLNALQKLVAAHPEFQITRNQRMTHAMVRFNRGQLTSARSEFRKAAAGHKDKITARATYYIGRAFHRQRKYDSALKEYNKIASLYPASGYLTRALYQSTLCYRRKGQPQLAEKHLIDFVEKYSWSALADDALYDLGWVQENEKLYDKATASYRRLTTQYTNSDRLPRAYWRIGWIQFRNERYTDCIATFTTLQKGFPHDSWAKAAQFWIAKTYERQNRLKEAETVYSKIAQASHWYYSGRAKEHLKRLRSKTDGSIKPEVLVAPRARVTVNSPAWKNIGSKKTPRVQQLMRLKLFEDALTELKGLIKRDNSNLRDDYYNLILCLEKLKKFQQAHGYADRLSRFQPLHGKNNAIPIELYRLLYPLYYADFLQKHTTKHEIDPLFVAAMIREESRYNADIVSYAGAIGLMQIMPANGPEFASRLKIPRFNTKMLYNPDINIQMGTWYMKSLMNQFDNNHALVAGAYNGGPGRMRRWIKAKQIPDLDEFIEDIGIDQTRRHIKKVIDSYIIYQQLYSNPAPASANIPPPTEG
jgi:soluble lytic murein transglycosylase-like protein/TolA-binding protein